MCRTNFPFVPCLTRASHPALLVVWGEQPFEANRKIPDDRPSVWERAVATYGLRKTVKHGEEADVKEFVERNSYVDDGLVSTPTADEVITLVKSTEATLTSANLRLHKLVSNSVSVMEAFCGEGSSERHSQSRALINAGYWLIGSHGAIAKLISSCILCKKLLGLLLEQKMADLPQTKRRLGLPLPASVSTCLEHGWYSPGSPVIVFFDRGHPRFWNLT